MDNLKGGDTSIREEKISVVDCILCKVGCVIGFIIKANNSGNLHFFEDGDIVIGSEDSILNV